MTEENNDDLNNESKSHKLSHFIQHPIGIIPFTKSTPYDHYRTKYSSLITFLNIKIISAFGVANTDWMSKPDPYCILRIDNRELCRTSIQRNTYSPIWNHKYTCIISGMLYDKCILVFSVYDKDRFTKDDFLGQVEIGLDDVVKGNLTGKSFMLESRKARFDKVTGSICIEISAKSGQKMEMEQQQGGGYGGDDCDQWHFQNGKLHPGSI
uniref:C2 domain-containing protein n=1 Tax=Timspurckia oligopyrenoides TaxID=708627 RepID=A0A7S0ZEP3_9RHOD|mmetsp:Transcript_2424/g.4240  ORF Transcript_2424/g.4240 Transcript_2424/m.4240 type:complete len:210 (+) Transcript_2424:122-751(+)